MMTSELRLHWSRPDRVLAFGFGAGLAPVAPGTFGTLVAVPLYWLLKSLHPGLYLAAIVLGIVVGVYICGRINRELAREDHPAIVWDEVVGYWVAMIGTPLSLPVVVAGFVLFRLFDIWKPWPIRALERKVGGGLGVMLDDLVAGILAAIVLHLGLNFLPV